MSQSDKDDEQNHWVVCRPIVRGAQPDSFEAIEVDIGECDGIDRVAIGSGRMPKGEWGINPLRPTE